MYLLINKWAIAVKVSNFSSQYLRNHWTLDIGVLGYIGIVWPKEHSPEVWSVPRVTLCIVWFRWMSVFKGCCEGKGVREVRILEELGKIEFWNKWETLYFDGRAEREWLCWKVYRLRPLALMLGTSTLECWELVAWSKCLEIFELLVNAKVLIWRYILVVFRKRGYRLLRPISFEGMNEFGRQYILNV